MSNENLSISNLETRGIAKKYIGNLFAFESNIFAITKFLNEQLGSYEDVRQSVITNNQSLESANIETQEKLPEELVYESQNEQNPLEKINTPQTLKALVEIKKKLSSETDSLSNFIIFDVKNTNKDDIKLINSLIQNTDMTNNIPQINVYNNFQNTYNKSGFTYKNIRFSQNLQDALYKAFKAKQPVRIDFDNKSSVILKLNKEGKVSAEFLTSDKAMELLLKENINTLKNKLDKEGLPYKDINYKNNNRKKRED